MQPDRSIKLASSVMRWWRDTPSLKAEMQNTKGEPEFVSLAKDILDNPDIPAHLGVPSARETVQVDTNEISQASASGREIVIGPATLLMIVTVAFAVPLGLSALLSHFLLKHFPADPFYAYYDDSDFARPGLDNFAAWGTLLLGYGISFTRGAVIPALGGILIFIALSDHAEIVQALIASSLPAK